MKTRADIVTQSYVSITDIETLLKVTFPKAKKIFLAAGEMEQTKFHETKVPLTNVMKATGISISTLLKQIEFEQKKTAHLSTDSGLK